MVDDFARIIKTFDIDKILSIRTNNYKNISLALGGVAADDINDSIGMAWEIWYQIY